MKSRIGRRILFALGIAPVVAKVAEASPAGTAGEATTVKLLPPVFSPSGRFPIPRPMGLVVDVACAGGSGGGGGSASSWRLSFSGVANDPWHSLARALTEFDAEDSACLSAEGFPLFMRARQPGHAALLRRLSAAPGAEGSSP